MSTATAETAPEVESKGGSKKIIVIVIAAALVVLVAAGLTAWMLLKPKGAAEDPATTPGAIATMKDPMTLNLADGKFLKTGLALQLSEQGTKTEGGKDAVAKSFDFSKAQDATIQTLGGYKYEQLLDPKTKQAAQTALSKEVAKRYDGEVIKVYFTQFVMQ